jgi:hypothetical protein
MSITVTVVTYGIKNVRGFKYIDRNPNSSTAIERLIFNPERFEENAESWEIYKEFKPHPKTFTYF